MRSNFYTFIIAFQIALIGVILNSIAGIQIPIIREVIGFLFLTFIPGLLLLIIFRIKNFNFVEWIFYSVNLSLSFLIFLGLFMNTFYPILGIAKPISLLPLVITLSISTILLTVIAFFRERGNQDCMFFYRSKFKINLTQLLLLSLLPFLSVFGTYLLNYYNNNILLLILILIIALIPFIVAFDKVQPDLYYFALYVIALSLLFHYSLVSGYLNGYDIHTEKYFSSQVIKFSYWDQNFSGSLNSLLSITIIAPIYSLITSMDVVWVYKIIYPLIFAFIALGLYILYRTQTNQKIAFFSIFFFMSVFTFYVGMPQLARQEIAELFFVALLCLILNDEIDVIKKSIMSTIFIFSLIFSHYSISYIFSFLILITWLIIYLIKEQKSRISSNFVMLSFTIMLTWYIYTSNYSNFFVLLRFLREILSNFTEFMNPNYVQGLQVIKSDLNITREITKWLHITSQVFVTVGLIQIFINKKSLITNIDSKLFLFISYLMCIAGITMPYISNSLNTMRLYHISLILLSPLFVIGAGALTKIATSTFTLNKHNRTIFYFLLPLFLSLFLIFNSGLVYEVSKEKPNYISFNNSIDDAPRFSETDVSAVNWMKNKKSSNISAYGDEYMRLLLSGITGENNFFAESEGTFYFVYLDDILKPKLKENAYIFLGERNVKFDRLFIHLYVMSDSEENPKSLKASPLQETLSDSNLIHNDGSTNIYIHQINPELVEKQDKLKNVSGS